MPPPPEGFKGRDSVGVATTYNLGGDGDGFEIGGRNANQSDGRAVFVHFKNETFRHKRAECCFGSPLDEWE